MTRNYKWNRSNCDWLCPCSWNESEGEGQKSTNQCRQILCGIRKFRREQVNYLVFFCFFSIQIYCVQMSPLLFILHIHFFNYMFPIELIWLIYSPASRMLSSLELSHRLFKIMIVMMNPMKAWIPVLWSSAVNLGIASAYNVVHEILVFWFFFSMQLSRCAKIYTFSPFYTWSGMKLYTLTQISM